MVTKKQEQFNESQQLFVVILMVGKDIVVAAAHQNQVTLRRENAFKANKTQSEPE